VLQERLMQRPYGARGELFAFPTFLILCNRALTALAAGAGLICSGQPLRARAPRGGYAGVAACNCVATYSQFALLRWLSFVAATLAKSGRPVAVMLWGIMLRGAAFGLGDWGAAAVALGGSLLFGLSGELLAPGAAEAAKKAAAGDGGGGAPATPFGGPLLLAALAIAAYLGFDGLTSTLQERLFREHEQPPLAMALHTGRWALLFALVAGLASGELPGALAFAQRHPALLRDVALLSSSVASSQYFILRTIRNHGALTFAFVMTTRQAVSVGLSWLVFPKAVTPGQFFGVGICFAGLYTRWYLQARSSRRLRVAQGLPPATADRLPSPVGRKG
jgi:adenosine 3'-phospho 5'-phosphosulfate transporter B2